MSENAPVPDGTYDAFVLDAQETDGVVTSIDVTIVTGAQKGSVLTVKVNGLTESFTEIVGVPAALTVDAGVPSLTFD